MRIGKQVETIDENILDSQASLFDDEGQGGSRNLLIMETPSPQRFFLTEQKKTQRIGSSGNKDY